MFIGEYQHTLDSKRRMSLPAKMRKECQTDLVATRGLDQCIFIYPKEDWRLMMSKLNDLSIGKQQTRDIARYFFASAEDISIDAAGRILVPEKLCEFANIKSDVVTIIGSGSRMELWNSESWTAYQIVLSLK